MDPKEAKYNMYHDEEQEDNVPLYNLAENLASGSSHITKMSAAMVQSNRGQ